MPQVGTADMACWQDKLSTVDAQAKNP